ncbi:MAG: DUF924 family protein [Pseudomonadota bacterium]|jgi:uncharacterized protein (DUF924 family)
MAPAAVLDFWFGAERAIALRDPARGRLWWRKDPATDAAIRARFGAWVARALAGGLEGWAAEPQGLMALVLLCDQFTRNIHRGTPAAFAGDARALAWSRQAIAAGWEAGLTVAERAFLYMPLEHSESPADQEESVARFSDLLAGAPAADRAALRRMLDHARRHRDVIRRFGRFPHRNAILGRPTTAAERAFLRTPGSAF